MIGTPELILILLVALLLFGPDKLPELANALGKSVKEFKKAQIEAEYDQKRLINCRNCSNLPNITEDGETKNVCKEKLEIKYEDHECHKYIRRFQLRKDR
jgi:TatA/E family protein of Tat protein translocase